MSVDTISSIIRFMDKSKYRPVRRLGNILQYIIVRDGLDNFKMAEVAADLSIECYRKLIRRINAEANITKNNNQHYYATIHNSWSKYALYKKIINGGNQFSMESLLNIIPDEVVTHVITEKFYDRENSDDILGICIGPDYKNKLEGLLMRIKLVD